MSDEKTVQASPTKKFFISILVRDIYLHDAIVELVDNSIDAARTFYGADGYQKCVVEINLSKERFSVSDNAGGISLDAARSRAFRFGRPEDSPTTPGSVGEFGVGMKRALFKIGREFKVTSTTTASHFVMKVDVDQWEKQDTTNPNDWTFAFDEFDEEKRAAEAVGTLVEVTNLYDYARDNFGNDQFLSRLLVLIREAHAEKLGRGLQVIINKLPVQAIPATLLMSDLIKPRRLERTLDVDGKAVTVRISAGVGDAKLTDAGWYIYCNGRLIERAEKSEKTGWSTELDGEALPKPHWQYRRFRGFVEFESDSQNTLPWNTTKTGLDVEAPAFRQVQADMRSAMREVITFLNELDVEGSTGGGLTDAVNAARPVNLPQLQESQTFVVTAKAPTAKRPKVTRITYDQPFEKVDLVKQHLGVSSNREVGERTFKYFLDGEGLEGEAVNE